jgi:hypothetical protein
VFQATKDFSTEKDSLFVVVFSVFLQCSYHNCRRQVVVGILVLVVVFSVAVQWWYSNLTLDCAAGGCSESVSNGGIHISLLVGFQLFPGGGILISLLVGS